MKRACALASYAYSFADHLNRTLLKFMYVIRGRIPWTSGYDVYKYDYITGIINSNQLEAFITGSLPYRYGYRMDERVVEYPWFFSRLKEQEKIILDAGSVLNFRQFLTNDKLATKNIYIATLYYEGRPKIPRSPSYIYEDLRDMCFKDDFFDAVCSLSTIEHIGYDNTMIYTPDASKREHDKNAHLIAIQECKRVLKKGGHFYLSVPFGTWRDHGWFQVFDTKMIKKVIDVFNPSNLTISYFKYFNNQWNYSDEVSCREGYCFDIHHNKKYELDYLAFSQCVICIDMTK